jgi:hypothetical protein
MTENTDERLEQFADYNAVEVLDNIVLIGEKHGGHTASRSFDLGVRVVDAIFDDIEAVAIERPPHDFYGTRGAMGVLTKYARLTGVPVVAIDRSYMSRMPDNVDHGKLLDIGNTFEDGVQKNGDVTRNDMHHARMAVQAEYGYDVYREFYNEREKLMASLLLATADQLAPGGGFVVAGVGAFHVTALASYIENHDTISDFSVPDRIPATRSTVFERQAVTDDRLDHWSNHTSAPLS